MYTARVLSTIPLILAFCFPLFAQTDKTTTPRIIQSDRPDFLVYESGRRLYFVREHSGGIAVACTTPDFPRVIPPAAAGGETRIPTGTDCGTDVLTIPRSDYIPVYTLEERKISPEDGVTTLGLPAGASAPEDLVQDLIAACRDRFDVTVETVETAREDVVFKLPRILEQS